MKKVLMIAAVLAAFVSTFARANDKGEESIVVMSYNIRMGVASDGTNSWQFRYPATAMMLEDQKPDVFGVQEAFDFQLKFILENCRQYKAVGVGREDGKSKGEHMSVFYNKKKFTLLKWGTFWLSETPDEPSKGWDAACHRTATWTLLKSKKTGRQFYFVNTHLDHVGKRAQEEGLALIVAKISCMNTKGLPMVLTGDFNIEPSNPILHDLNKMMESARESAEKTDHLNTFNDWGRSSSVIDYIYHKGFSKCPLFQTVQKPYDNRAYISDHFPVKAVLTF